MSQRYWVWVFGAADGLRWVLEHNRMAFGNAARIRVQKHQPGDLVVLYTTRGAYGKSTDQARIAGVVQVTKDPEENETVTIGGRDLDWFVPFEQERILPERTGPDVLQLVGELAFVKKPAIWGQYFRNSPFEISGKDFKVLAGAVRKWK